MITKEIMVGGVFALYVALMLTQFLEYRWYPQSRVASALIMAMTSVMVIIFGIAAPHL